MSELTSKLMGVTFEKPVYSIEKLDSGELSLINRLENLQKILDEVYHGEDDEPYEGAGYCVCRICQEFHPLIVDTIQHIQLKI